MKKLLFDLEASENKLEKVITPLKIELLKKNPFCLLLSADIGAGKSTLARALLHALGLAPNVVVTSPTFSLLSEYEIKGEIIAHLDLYRLGQDDVDHSFFLERPYREFLIEWGEKFEGVLPIPFSHRLDISFLQEKRRYMLSENLPH